MKEYSEGHLLENGSVPLRKKTVPTLRQASKMLLPSSPQAQVTPSCRQSPGCLEFSILPSGVLSVAMETRETVAFLSVFLQETSCCQRCLKLALEGKAVHISSSDTMQRALWPSSSQRGVCHTLSPSLSFTQMALPPC